MTEVKESWQGHLGLYATQDFEVGDTILMELAPLVRLAPKSTEESHQLYLQWIGHQPPSLVKNSESPTVAATKRERKSDHRETTRTLWDSIVVPSDVDEFHHGTFKGMVQAGMVWMLRSCCDDVPNRSTELENVLKLYHPINTIDDGTCAQPEKVVLKLSTKAIEYLKDHSTNHNTYGNKFQDWETLQCILHVWACNSFQGGLIYDKFSRINHSCNPNAVIQPGEEDGGYGQRLVAGCKIDCGSEIFISYLGILLYADTPSRRRKLQQTKYFDCHCQRCSALSDAAAQTPCPTCHPRHPTQLSLDEDVQYDDEQQVQYMSLLANTTDTCSKCHTQPKHVERLTKLLANVNNKVYEFIDTYQGSTRYMTAKGNTCHDESNEEDAIVLEEHVSLASTMMGAKHWTTNVLLLLHLDHRLSVMSQCMLTTQELPDMQDLAEAIDTLQRLYRFVDSLQLHLDPGHLLGDVTIGIARTLVSLGDEKSQKYGAEWLSKIDNYVDQFGSEGIQKIVTALKSAWKKHSRSDNDTLLTKNESERKKVKSIESDQEMNCETERNSSMQPQNKVRDEFFMRHALNVAERALEIGEVPVGCVIVLTNHPIIDRAKADAAVPLASTTTHCDDDFLMDSHVVISHGANQVNATRDATRHAEIVAIDRLLTDGQSSDQLRLPPEIDTKGRNIPSNIQIARTKQWEDEWINEPDRPTHWKNSFGWRNNRYADSLRSPNIFSSCELYVTCEPCIMCAAALATVGIKRVVFGCKNSRFGGCGSLLHLHQAEMTENTTRDDSLSKGYTVTSGILEAEAIHLLQSFYDRENFHAPDAKRKEKENKW